MWVVIEQQLSPTFERERMCIHGPFPAKSVAEWWADHRRVLLESSARQDGILEYYKNHEPTFKTVPLYEPQWPLT